MKFIWNRINRTKFSVDVKTYLFLICTTVLFSLAGLLVWFVLHFFFLDSVSWAICFAGYPGLFFGLMGGVLYLFRHEMT